MITKYLGLAIPDDADLAVAPLLRGYGSVEFDIPGYAVLYRYSESGFVLKDLSDKARRIEVDLSALETGSMHYRLMGKPRSGLVGRRSTLTLAGHEEVRWIRESVVNHAPK